jgi:hypothetical protein
MDEVKEEHKYGLEDFSTERLMEIYKFCKAFEKADDGSKNTIFEIKKVILKRKMDKV